MLRKKNWSKMCCSDIHGPILHKDKHYKLGQLVTPTGFISNIMPCMVHGLNESIVDMRDLKT